MKTYKILSESVTGLNSNRFLAGEVVSADRLINIAELVACKAIEEVKEEKETSPKTEKTKA